MRILNVNLGGQTDPLTASKYFRLASMLMYMQPDVIALHNAHAQSAGDSGAVYRLAKAMGMYCAFKSPFPGGTIGTALLSRHPMETTSPPAAGAPPDSLAMIQAEVEGSVGRARLLAVYPVTAAAGKAAAEAIASAVKASPDMRLIVMFSLPPDAGDEHALAILKQAGLVDPFEVEKAVSPLTYPAAKPERRLDFILASPGLRAALRDSSVLPRWQGQPILEHLPVQLEIAY